MTKPLRFPSGFLWGAATSAHQVEGGNRANDWWRFEQQPGAIQDGATSGDACRHWERFDEDFALAASDGHNAHRLSLEWSRIEPERGRTDESALAHYRAVLESLRRRGLEPVVTLHHFTNPLWIADAGGWENPATLDHFDAFVRLCAREFGGLVDWWCTVNEPEVYAFRSYAEGVWPPGRRDDSAALAVMANLLEAHGRAYRILHEEDRADADGDGRAARVGFAKHWVVLEPWRPWNPLDVLRAHFENAVFNFAVADAPVTGRICLSIPGARGVNRRVEALRDSQDWIGLNYYTRWMVAIGATDSHVVAARAERNDLGWENYPAGIEAAIRRLARAGRPILITENGTADAADTLRPRALVETLRHVHRTIEAGAPVVGYLHWSLMDNFEWADGYRGRFGLYAVDFGDPTLERRRRHSADLFARIARANALEDAVIAEATGAHPAPASPVTAPGRLD